MNKENIIKLRELFKDTGLTIFSDNAKLFNDTAENTTIIWDDTAELMYAFRPTTSQYTQSTKPIIVEAVEYESIQYMSTGLNKTSLINLLSQLTAAGTITQADSIKILNDYQKL